MEIKMSELPLDTEGTFKFTYAENNTLQDKKFKEMLLKWGLDKTLELHSFRFNQKYEDVSQQTFLLDLFNSVDFRKVFNFLPFPKENLQKIEFQKLKCTQVKLDMFDKLEKNNLVVEDSIKRTFGDQFEEIEVVDLIREAILKEESEHYDVFDANERQELLFRVFKLLELGGSMCQYEDLLSVYLDWTKYLYKNIVYARKDEQTQNVYVESFAFEIKSIGNEVVSSQHPQNILYVVVNPSLRLVNILYNKWTSFW